jgi:hypothetical protein
MTNFELHTSEIIKYPEDVNKLRAAGIAGFTMLSDSQIQHLYSIYSERFWSADWINIHDEAIKEFAEWLWQDIEARR